MTVFLCAFSFFLKWIYPEEGYANPHSHPQCFVCLGFSCVSLMPANPHPMNTHHTLPPRSSLPQQTPPFSRCCVFSGNLVMVIEFQIIAMSYVCTICRHVWHAELTGQHTLPGHRTHTQTHPLHTHTHYKNIYRCRHSTHTGHIWLQLRVFHICVAPPLFLSLFVPFSPSLSLPLFQVAISISPCPIMWVCPCVCLCFGFVCEFF